MKRSVSKIAGWVLSGLLAVFLCVASASGKFIDFEGKAEMFDHLGWSTDVMAAIGIVEILIALLFLIPRTAFIAAILLTAYLGGATATHVRVDDPFFFPIIMGVVAWIALGLRDPRVFLVAFRASVKDEFRADK
ncbi:MAG TPA: DoxX family protein [Planctomicrobium sp.]|nr:DoxX family protein [Planctomicrobium sp.]